MTKKNMMIAAVLGMGVMGYMYMKNNPDATKNMKQMVRSAAKRTYEMMSDVD